METVDSYQTKDLTYLCNCIFVSLRTSKNLSFLPQKLRNFHSLSCPGITGEDSCESATQHAQCNTDDSSANEHVLEDVQPQTKEGEITRNESSDPTIEEVDWNSTDCGDVTPETTNGKENESLWVGLCSMRKDVYQLGGELDIEQIERN